MKVLILAYDFPPYVSVGGLRPYNWYKYLHEFDYYPIVVTRQWENAYGNELDYVAPGSSSEIIIEKTEHGTIIRTPYRPNLSNRLLLKHGNKRFKWIRKIITGYFEILQFYFNIGPKLAIYKAAKQYLENNDVDCIIATGDPFILFRYAHKLSKAAHKPWIADYRDPWSSSLNSSKNPIRNRWNRIQEKRCVKSSALITTVDELFKRKIGKVFPNKRVEIIANGYDPEPFQDAAYISQNSSELRIAFVGTIYKWHPIKIFLEEFKQFINKLDSPKVKLVFYGINIENEIKDWIGAQNLNIEPYIEINPRIENSELIQRLANDNVMLLFNYYTFTGTKIYDYLALNRKILFCFSNDPESDAIKEQFYYTEDFPELRPQEKLIKERNAGIIVNKRSELGQKLNELYDEFLQKGFIETHSIVTGLYSRRNQAKMLAELFNELNKICKRL